RPKKRTSAQGHVCLAPESGHVRCTSACRLWAKSGHDALKLQCPRQYAEIRINSAAAIGISRPRIGHWGRFTMEFNRWQLLKGLAATCGILGIVSLALIYFIPAPPSKVVMATAFKGASFEYYGRQYREVFARSHIELELRETAGAVENVKLLQ